MIPSLTPVARIKVSIAHPLASGPSESRLREVIPIIGGSVDGPLLKDCHDNRHAVRHLPHALASCYRF